METTEKCIGLAYPNGGLVMVSECCSQIEGGDADGPCLWYDREKAMEALEHEIPEGYQLVEVTISYSINE